MNDWLRGLHDWRDLFDLLPGIVARRGSHYAAALEDDDDLAESLLDIDDRGPARPPLLGWTDERDDLADIKDMLLALLHRGSDKRPEFTSRPQLAVDRVKRDRMRVRESRVLDQLLPGRH